jgi:hypothetical protein
MGFLKRVVFYMGLVLGLLTVATVGTVFLTYLFTGKFPSVKSEEGKTLVELLTVDEMATFIREQADKAKAAQATGGTGGDDNGHS